MSADRPTIRPARDDEVGVLQALEWDAGRAYGDLPGYAFCVGLPVRDAEEHTQVRALGVALVAEWQGGVTGFILGLPIDGRAHILEMAVRHGHQGRGYGRLLLEAFERWALRAGFAEATLTTFRDVPWNAPAYSRLGFHIFDPNEDRRQLRALIAEERRAGFDRAPRVVMRKIYAINHCA